MASLFTTTPHKVRKQVSSRPQRRRRCFFEPLESRNLLAVGVIPNDPDFPAQWVLHNTGQSGGIVDADIDAPQAWEITTGSMQTVVAILDDGVDYTHPDLYLNIWLNQAEIPANIANNLSDADGDGILSFRDLNAPINASYTSDLNGNGYIDGGDLLADPNWENGLDEDTNGQVDDLIGWDFRDDDNDPQHENENDHGTNAARIIGAVGNNGIAGAGINWQIRMMPVRITLRGEGAEIVDSQVAAGIDYAADSEASIIDAGYRGTPHATADAFSQVMFDAIDRSRQAGVLFVAAAGNAARDTDVHPWYPQSYEVDNIISSGALSETGDQLSLSSITNWGATTVDYAVSTYNGTTSHALAHATGIAALIKSVHPEWTYSQIKARMLGTVDPVPSLAGTTVTGGRLNAARAVGFVEPTVVFADSFELGNNSNDWAGNWVEDSQNDWFRSTQRATDGTRSAEVDGSATDATLTLATPLDLSGYSSAELTFDWLIESSFDGGEYLSLDVSSNGGASWQMDMRRLSGNVDLENVWHSETVDLTPYISSHLLVRFRSKVSSSSEDADVDNVQIVGTMAGPPEISISDANSSEGGWEWAFADTLAMADETIQGGSGAVAAATNGDMFVSFTERIIDSSGNVSPGQSRIARIDAVTGQVDKDFIPLGTSGLSLVWALEVHNGWIYVSNKATNEVLRFSEATGLPDPNGAFIPAGAGGMVEPRGIVFDAAGDLLVNSKGTDEILKFRGSDGAYLGVFAADVTNGGVGPKDLARDPTTGNLYVSGVEGVVKYAADGTLIGSITIPGIAIAGVELGDDGTLFASDFLNHLVYQVDAATGDTLSVLQLDSSIDQPLGLGFDGAGTLYVATQAGTGDVYRFAPSSSGVFTVSLSSPSGLPVTVDFASADGTAIAGTDYGGVSGTLIFELGVTSRTIIIPTIDDAELEPTETFKVILSNATGATLVDNEGIGEIIDNEVPNSPPIVDAGANLTLSDGDGTGAESVTIVGSAIDSDGSVVAVQWTEGATLLGNAATLNTTLSVGIHVLTLTATDNEGATSSDTVTVHVLANQAPTANAGADISVTDNDDNGSEVISLSGSGSDADGMISFQWREGSTLLGNTANLTITLPVGTHVLTLTVTDNGGATSSDSLVVTIAEPPSEIPLYVYDIRFESFWGYRRAVFEIRTDSNGDNQGSSADARAAGVAITVQFGGRTYSGTTDSSGIFRTGYLRVGSGSYAEVVDLALAGFYWDPLSLDLEDDSDGDGRPDAIL